MIKFKKFPADTPGSVYTVAEIDAMITALAGLYLKLNQIVPQSVINGAPSFNGDGTNAIIIKAGQRLVFDGA